MTGDSFDPPRATCVTCGAPDDRVPTRDGAATSAVWQCRPCLSTMQRRAVMARAAAWRRTIEQPSGPERARWGETARAVARDVRAYFACLGEEPDPDTAAFLAHYPA